MYAANARCAFLNIFSWLLQYVEDHDWLVLGFLLSPTFLLLETLARRQCGCGCGVILASRTHSCCWASQIIQRGFTGSRKICFCSRFQVVLSNLLVLTSGAVLQKMICLAYPQPGWFWNSPKWACLTMSESEQSWYNGCSVFLAAPQRFVSHFRTDMPACQTPNFDGLVLVLLSSKLRGGSCVRRCWWRCGVGVGIPYFARHDSMIPRMFRLLVLTTITPGRCNRGATEQLPRRWHPWVSGDVRHRPSRSLRSQY